MPITIARTFLIWLVGVLVLTLILVSGLVLRHERQFLMAEQRASTRLLARVLAVAVVEGEAPVRLPVEAMTDLRALEVRGSGGRLLWRFGPSPDEVLALDASLLVVREPIPDGGGEVVLVASPTRLHHHLLASAVRLLGGLLLALLLSLVIGLALVSRIAQPLRELSASVREYRLTAAPAREPAAMASAEVVELARAFADMTRRLASQEAEKMEAVGTLAGGVAHDFNNLLAGILLHLRWLERDPGARGEAAVAIRALAEEGSEVVQELLLFARRESTPARELDLAELVRELGPVLRHLVAESTELEVRLAGPVPVLGSPVGLRRLLLNLVLNSRDAIAGEGGRITVRVGAEGEHAVLEVADNGAGVAPEIRGRMFEPFVSMRREGRGAGLGLAVVYAVATAHGGAIQVESEPGAGTRVRVLLPRAQGGEGEAGTHADPLPAGLRVLLVEGDGRLAARLVEDLAARGIEVRHVLTVEAAAEVAGEWSPQVVAADLTTAPGDAVDRLLAFGGPVVAVTAAGGAWAADGVVVLPPPLEPAALVEALAQALDSSGRAQVP